MSCFFKASTILKKYFSVFTASDNFMLLKYSISIFRFSLPVTATAENCMLTVYPYMAIHLDEDNIIVRNGKLHMTIFYHCVCSCYPRLTSRSKLTLKIHRCLLNSYHYQEPCLVLRVEYGSVS